MARGPLYSFVEDQILLKCDTLTLKQIGDLIGRTEISVKNRRVRLIAAGLDDPRYTEFTDEEARFITEHPDMRILETAARLGRSRQAIAELRHRLIESGQIPKRMNPRGPRRLPAATSLVLTSDHAHQATTAQNAGRRSRRWTDDDDAYLIAHADDPDHEIAVYLGRTLWAVRTRTGNLRKDGRIG